MKRHDDPVKSLHIWLQGQAEAGVLFRDVQDALVCYREERQDTLSHDDWQALMFRLLAQLCQLGGRLKVVHRTSFDYELWTLAVGANIESWPR